MSSNDARCRRQVSRKDDLGLIWFRCNSRRKGNDKVALAAPVPGESGQSTGADNAQVKFHEAVREQRVDDVFRQVRPDAADSSKNGRSAAGLHLGFGWLGCHRLGQWRQDVLVHDERVPPLHGEEGSSFQVAFGWHCTETSAAGFRRRRRFRCDVQEPAYVLPVGLRLGKQPAHSIAPADIQPPKGHQGGKVL